MRRSPVDFYGDAGDVPLHAPVELPASERPCYNFGHWGQAMKSRKLAKSRVAKHSIAIGGRHTSISLEDQFWEALKEIAKERGSTPADLVTSIDADRRERNLSSAIRLFVLGYYQARK